jgi:hypothetical protein
VLETVAIRPRDPVQGLAESDGDERTTFSPKVLVHSLAKSAVSQLETAKSEVRATREKIRLSHALTNQPTADQDRAGDGEV